MLRRSKIRKVFSEMWHGDEEIVVDLGELAHMFDRNPLGCQDSRRACGQAKEVARGGGVAEKPPEWTNGETINHRYIRDQKKS